MDYEALLKKYINHVGECEGTTFLGEHYRDSIGGAPVFTDEEWAELKRLALI